MEFCDTKTALEQQSSFVIFIYLFFFNLIVIHLQMCLEFMNFN